MQKVESTLFYVNSHRVLYWKDESAHKVQSGQKVESTQKSSGI